MTVNIDEKTIDFINKAKKIFPEYDYSKTIYINSNTKVIVICLKHGEQSFIPYNLLKGHGCKYCGYESSSKKQKNTSSSFISKAEKLHPEYDYSQVTYCNNKTNIKVICKKHGIFEITPANLLRGRGCRICRIEKSKDTRIYTTEEFIDKAKKYFPQYDYSKVVYSGAFSKVTIICPRHGEFEIRPSYLTSNIGGCQKCGYESSANKNRSNREEFIEKAKKIHPEYDYSLVEYNNARTKVNIICTEHGIFSVTPDSLLRGTKCNECMKIKRIQNSRDSKDEFIIKAKKVHPEYNYSLVKYINSQTKVTVICSKHGKFLIRPNTLIMGGGCWNCSVEYRASLCRFTTEEFIEKAKNKHPEYDYSKVNYINANTKIKIICPKHGEFLTSPQTILYRSIGCINCAFERIAEKNTLSQDEAIKRMKKIFPEYDYSQVLYKSNSDKVKVICLKHGAFDIVPSSIFQGHGCPTCKMPKGELYIRNWLVINGIIFETQKKYKELGKLSYDFYIPDWNLLIEYNGEQHYGIVPYFNHNPRSDKYGLMGLRIQFENDMKKKNFAISKGIKLLTIPYWEYENINTILEDNLFINP